MSDVSKFNIDGNNIDVKDSYAREQIALLQGAMFPVGAIIESTTCDTMTKVIENYGGTTWVQHSGYVLRGATTGVVANSTSKTGGNDDSIVPYHTHGNGTLGTANGGSWSFQNRALFNRAGSTYNVSSPTNVILGSTTDGNYKVSNNDYTTSVTGGNTSVTHFGHTHTVNGSIAYAGTNGNTTNANIPNYKSVYIWERTA